jgi:hypothetical protein
VCFGSTYVPYNIDCITPSEAGLVSSSHVNQPFLLSVGLGRQLALPVADVDSFDFVLGEFGCADLYRVRDIARNVLFGFLEPCSCLICERRLVGRDEQRK